jgi:hypothetical protein
MTVHRVHGEENERKKGPAQAQPGQARESAIAGAYFFAAA